MTTSEQTYDFNTADFDAVYRGGEFLSGSTITGVPWDISDVQPAVEALEARGRFRGDVLDAGCGLGDNAVFLADRGYAVVALDAAPSAIAQARERAAGRAVTFDVADATRLDGYEGRFDTVLDSALYHTMDAPERRELLAALHRVARPGAWLNMLCFAAVDGGMPAGLAVEQDAVREDLAAAGWEITELYRTTFAGVAEVVEDFVRSSGGRPEVDAAGRIQLPVWSIEATRI